MYTNSLHHVLRFVLFLYYVLQFISCLNVRIMRCSLSNELQFVLCITVCIIRYSLPNELQLYNSAPRSLSSYSPLLILVLYHSKLTYVANCLNWRMRTLVDVWAHFLHTQNSKHWTDRHRMFKWRISSYEQFYMNQIARLFLCERTSLGFLVHWQWTRAWSN